MSKIIRAAAVQIAPVLYSREGTVDKVVKKILELGKQGVQFATFPETVVPYLLDGHRARLHHSALPSHPSAAVPRQGS